jgi:hypothetical protein
VRCSILLRNLHKNYSVASPPPPETLNYIFIESQSVIPSMHLLHFILNKNYMLIPFFSMTVKIQFFPFFLRVVKASEKVFRPKRNDATGEWRKVHSEILDNLYSSPNVIRHIMPRRMRWAGHVARMGALYHFLHTHTQLL